MSSFVGSDKSIRSHNLYDIEDFHFSFPKGACLTAPALTEHANGSSSSPAFTALRLSNSSHSDESVIICHYGLAGIFLVYDVPGHLFIYLLAFGQLL